MNHGRPWKMFSITEFLNCFRVEDSVKIPNFQYESVKRLDIRLLRSQQLKYRIIIKDMEDQSKRGRMQKLMGVAIDCPC